MPEEKLELTKFVEGGEGISYVRTNGNCRQWNNIRYQAGLSAKNVGSKKLSMNVVLCHTLILG